MNRRLASEVIPTTCAFVINPVSSSTSSQCSYNLAHAFDIFLALIVASPSAGHPRATSSQSSNEYPSGERQYELAPAF